MKYQFDHRVKEFAQLLNRVDPDQLKSSAYSQRYLAHLMEHRLYFISIYSQLLDKVIRLAKKEPPQVSLLDYGAGNGLLAMFASYCGFQKVYINDMDAGFISAAEQTAAQLGITIEGFIAGDINKTRECLNSSPPDIIVGTDVIEHIYNLDEFLRELHQLNPAIVAGFTTAANIHNPVKRKRIIALQQKDEFQGSSPTDGILTGQEAHPSFLSLRREIIVKQLPGETPAIIDQLAKATRGMNKDDVIRACTSFRDSGTLPDPPKHPTNTCDPLTGSWTERLMSMDEYTAAFRRAGFNLSHSCGFYDTHKSQWHKNLVGKLLNIGVRLAGKSLAPYLVLTGNSTVFNET